MFLGLDLGTSGLRGLLVDDAGHAISESSVSYDVSHPHDGWSEQDPHVWISACEQVFQQLHNDTPDAFKAVRGIGISGHMHGAVALDASLDIVRPCILWNDTRSYLEAAELDSDPAFRAKSGNIVFPGFTAPKLKWMARNEPENFGRVAHVMLPKDYLVLWLTGVVATEMSDASGTSWLDVGKRDWSSDLVAATELDMHVMPKLFEGSEVVGPIKGDSADQYGLSRDLKVVAGGADNACAACGIGAFTESEGFASLGTSGVVLIARDRYAPEAASAVHTFCHAVPNKWYQMGVILAATDSLEWLAGSLKSSAADLDAGLPKAVEGPGTTMFLPYLSGERTPHNDAEARGMFTGLSRTTQDAELTQAVMEGVSFAMRDCLETLRQTGSNPSSLIAVGGGSKSEFWLSTLANTLNVEIKIPEKGDYGAALGAARLAMIGAGDLAPEDVMTTPVIEGSIHPDPMLVPLYERAFRKYQKTYLALKDIT